MLMRRWMAVAIASAVFLAMNPARSGGPEDEAYELNRDGMVAMSQAAAIAAIPLRCCRI